MLHQFKAPFVYVHRVQNHDAIKAQLMPNILSFYHEHKNDPDYHWAKSKTVNSHCHQDLSIFTPEMYREIVWNPLDAMLNELPDYSKPYKSYLTSMWWNIYPPQSFAEVHDHRCYDISGAYFLHLTEPNTLCFDPPCHDGFFPFTHETLHTDDITSEGDVVLFPSALRHYVNPCLELRATISFNIACDITETNTNPLSQVLNAKR